MNYQQLSTLISTNNLQLLTDKEIVVALNAPVGTRHIAKVLNSRDLMSILGAITAATILKKLTIAATTNPVLEFVMPFMEKEGINFGDKETLQSFDYLSAVGVITDVERDLLKGLTLVPSSLALTALGEEVNEAQVSIAQRGI